MDKTLIKHFWHPELDEQQTIETMPVEVDCNEWFKHSGLVLQLYSADEKKIRKTNRAHLIKSLLSGNYLMKTFALTHLDFQQSRNWQKESCLFSKRLEQKNRTRQTIDEEEDQMEKWAYNLQFVTGYIHTAAQFPKSFPHMTQVWCWLVSVNSLKEEITMSLMWTEPRNRDGSDFKSRPIPTNNPMPVFN